jgi:hypothetical protein
MTLTAVGTTAAVLASGLAGCGSASRSPASGPSIPVPPGAVTGVAFGSPQPYTLYTHCGIDWALIHGRWYEAVHPLSDGQGNPPPGWGNPDQPGVITLTSAARALFRDAVGHRVELVLRPGATGPPHPCS